jgi:hypothetical protein
MFIMLVKLHEEPMRSTLAVVNAELSNRVVVLLSDEMLAALDEWRWQHRVSSRGEAIRLMVADALEKGALKPRGAEGRKAAEAPTKGKPK